ISADRENFFFGGDFLVSPCPKDGVVGQSFLMLHYSPTMLQHPIVLPKPNENIHLLLGYM
ncbi:hypothetical protein, partial [Bacteroides acidifaciens]|uniref:hypothetical protein n=1 Tax=Bacteroides acidifaciens TaxID=85831 RepID=UPI0026DFCEFA